MLEGTDWTTVLVAAVSGASGALGPLALNYFANRKEKRSVRAALLAEVGAIARIVRDRRYIEDCIEIVEEIAKVTAAPDRYIVTEPPCIRVVVPAEYNLMYRSNSEKLGALSPEEATCVVYFYQLIQSVIADTSPGGGAHDGSMDPEPFEATRQMLTKALQLADQLCRERRRP